MNPLATHHHTLPASLGLRLAHTSKPAIAWLPWRVVARTHGFHVSRESASGARTQALLNTVGRTKVFRKRDHATAACAKANAAGGAA